MSLPCVRGALLTECKGHQMLRHALARLSVHRYYLCSVALHVATPPNTLPLPITTSTASSQTHAQLSLPLPLTDSHPPWIHLDELSVHIPILRRQLTQGQGDPDGGRGPSPAQLSFVLLKLREEVETVVPCLLATLGLQADTRRIFYSYVRRHLHTIHRIVYIPLR